MIKLGGSPGSDIKAESAEAEIRLVDILDEDDVSVAEIDFDVSADVDNLALHLLVRQVESFEVDAVDALLEIQNRVAPH